MNIKLLYGDTETFASYSDALDFLEYLKSVLSDFNVPSVVFSSDKALSTEDDTIPVIAIGTKDEAIAIEALKEARGIEDDEDEDEDEDIDPDEVGL